MVQLVSRRETSCKDHKETMAENTEENIKTAKIKRRNGKAALTRLGKAINLKRSGNRSAEEIRESLDLYEKAFLDLTSKHEELILLVEDDGQFEEEEKWFEAVQETFFQLKIDTEDHIQFQIEKEKQNTPSESPSTESSSKNVATTSTSETASESKEGNQSAQLLSENPVVTMASLPSTQENPASQVSPTLVTSIPTSESPVPHLSQTSTVIPASEIATVAPEIPAVTAKASTTSGYLNNQCNFQMEKPKLPKFSGDVRDYAIFKADFKHVVETRYGKRDAITILRTSLQGKPLDMIKGIGQDYDAAWEYLDSVYGDPRYVADMIAVRTIVLDIYNFMNI